MFNYKKAINDGMRSAIRNILLQIKNIGIQKGEIYIKFKLQPEHFNQIATLIPDYADYFTIELSSNNYKNLVVEDDFFKVDIPTEEDPTENTKFVNIKILISSIIHFIDTQQNVSIEIEDDEIQHNTKKHSNNNFERKVH